MCTYIPFVHIFCRDVSWYFTCVKNCIKKRTLQVAWNYFTPIVRIKKSATWDRKVLEAVTSNVEEFQFESDKYHCFKNISMRIFFST